MENTLTTKEQEALRQIRQHILSKGKFPSVRELMTALGYRSPRSASVLIKQLIEKGILSRQEDGSIKLDLEIESDQSNANTIKVPLVGTVACGLPIMAEENIEAMIPVSTALARAPYQYFLLKVQGDSMNECEIYDQDLVLIRRQSTANNGDLVVALIDDEATVKEYWQARNTIILKPRSSNKDHQPIILNQDFQILGVVVTAIPNIF